MIKASGELNNDGKIEPIESAPSPQSVSGLNALLFCMSDVRNGVGPLLSIHLRNTLQWDPAKIGIALATVEFSAFLTQIPAGLLADASKSKRAVVATAICLIILGCLILLSFSAFPLVIIAQLLMGISIALISPALGAITLGLFGRKKLPSRIGKNEVFNHSGNVISAFTAGITGYLFGSQWIFFLVIGFAIGSLISLSFIKPGEINYAVARELPKDKDAKPLPLSMLFKRKAILIFNFCMILYYMANGAQMSLVGQILANKDPVHSALYISACMIIAEITMIGVAYTMSRIVNHFNRKTFFLTAILILPVRAFLYTLVESPQYLLLIQILDGIAAGILGTIGGVINSDLAIDTGRFNFLQGMGAMSTNMGESISQLFAGFIAKSFGFNTSFYALAMVALCGASIFAFFMPETKIVHESATK
ncbi:MAG: MFS transporter [Candidatus Protochlamydia sp.]|nr:MFS transporter [Candidatus Protochlamydia sp.]